LLAGSRLILGVAKDSRRTHARHVLGKGFCQAIHQCFETNRALMIIGIFKGFDTFTNSKPGTYGKQQVGRY